MAQGGATKRKLELVSGARIELCEDDDCKLEIYGTDDERGRAHDYCQFVMAQRVGAVTIDFDQTRPDMSAVKVPEDCVAYIMGRKGQVLRSFEEQWGTIMFFAKVSTTGACRTEWAVLAVRKCRAKKGGKASYFWLSSRSLRS